MCVRQLEAGEYAVRNAYGRYVKPGGNTAAQERMNEVFEPEDRHWRGLGLIPGGGMRLRREWNDMDAVLRFECGKGKPGADKASGCLAGKVLRGLIRPGECPFFGSSCTPLAPLDCGTSDTQSPESAVIRPSAAPAAAAARRGRAMGSPRAAATP